jgi:hypothetical protein
MACTLLLIMLSLIALAPFLDFIFSLEYVYILNHCGLYENSIEMIVRDKEGLSQTDLHRGLHPLAGLVHQSSRLTPTRFRTCEQLEASFSLFLRASNVHSCKHDVH